MKNKLRRAWQWVKGEYLMIILWIKNVHLVYLSSQSRFAIFEGYGHWKFAMKYADKRTDMSSKSKVVGRKRHYVIPIGNYSLGVLNRTEINQLKARRMFSKNLNIVKLLEHAYYITK